MATKIQIRRGAGLPPSTLAQGELAYDTQNQRLYIGTGNNEAPYKEIGSFDTLIEFGITATAEELNKLEGALVTTQELDLLSQYADKLGYLENVTSDIQAEIDSKISSNHSHGFINVDGKITSAFSAAQSGDYLVITDASNDNKLTRGKQLESYIAGSNKFIRADGSIVSTDADTSLQVDVEDAGLNAVIRLRGNNSQLVEETKSSLFINAGHNIVVDANGTNETILFSTPDDLTLTKNGTENVSSHAIVLQGNSALFGGDHEKELKMNVAGELAFGADTMVTKTYVDLKVSNLVDTAPTTLDTLNELAAALGDDPNFATTTSTALGNRLRFDINNQGLTNLQKEQALLNLGIIASPTQLNKLNGATVTTTEINHLSGVTADIQTQLDTKQTNLTGAATSIVTNNLPTVRVVTTDLSGKINTSVINVQELERLDGVTSNIQNQIDSFTNDKAPLNSPVFTGTPTAPTAQPITNTTQLATTQFVNTAISNVNGYTPALLEWELIEKFIFSGGTISVTNNSFTTGGYDISNYDYKFVVDLDTTIEDNDSPYIRINGYSFNIYNYVYERVSLNAVFNPGVGQSTSFGGYDQNLINTGLLLGSASQDVALTHLHLEFTVSQSYGFFTYGDNFYSIFVEGKGSALAIDSPLGTPIVFPIMSKFTGNIREDNELSQVDIIHNITAGDVDNSIVRLYKRPK